MEEEYAGHVEDAIKYLACKRRENRKRTELEIANDVILGLAELREVFPEDEDTLNQAIRGVWEWADRVGIGAE